MFKAILENRGVISIAGSDASVFLQGLISNDIYKSGTEHLLYAFFLSPQGRFLCDFFIHKQEGVYLLDAPKSQILDVVKKFNMYKLRSDVQILDVSDKYKVLITSKKTDGAFADPRLQALGFRAVVQTEISEVGSLSDYEKIRIDNLIPDADKDFIINKSFPHEFDSNRLNAIDYNKGCYVGQELTARTNYRGVVRKGLVVFESEVPINKESEISSDGKKIGIILGMEGNLGLCLVNIEEMARVLRDRGEFFVESNKIILRHAKL